MMDISTEIPEFSGLCRLFPLPDVVLFPHVILPLHIFEPRYRQMTQEALEGDRLITMVQGCPASSQDRWAEPMPIADVGCVGKIVQHDRLPDGRFNLLLLGCRRVWLKREVASTKLYRVAEGLLLDDEGRDDPMPESRHLLIDLFSELLQASHRADPDLSRLLRSDVSTGVLSDIIAHALPLPASVKQQLLAETGVPCRVETLVALLRDLLGRVAPPPRFPPPFSLN